MIKISRFRSCTKTPPKKDGTYLVVKMWKGKFSLALAMKYSLEYGWNADSWSHDSVITFEESEHAMWATVTEEKQPRKSNKRR